MKENKADSVSDSAEILLYENGGDWQYVQVIFKDETFWLTQAAMAELFESSKSNISEYLSRIFEDGELEKDRRLRKFGISELSTSTPSSGTL